MDMNIRKKILLITTLMLVIFVSNINHSKAATATPDYINNLNIETKTFVNRVNQLPQNFTFNQTLKRGAAVSPDVQYLKWVLNSDIRTALTDNPNMTLTELTSAFGPITEAAVKKFQTIYKSEILDPQGITNATGIVGNATKLKLNALLTKSRLVANYSNTLNTSTLNQTAVNPQYYIDTTNYNNYNNNYVDFSYLYLPNSNTTTTTIATSSTQTSSTSIQVVPVNSSIGTPDNGPSTGLVIAGGALLVGGLLSGGAGTAAGAAAQTILSQFGGKITNIEICNCSSGFMMTLLDMSTKTPLSIIFQTGVSTLKMNYNPTVGQTVMGGYIKKAATCMIYAGSSCSPHGNPKGVVDTIRGMGTTLTPSI